MKVLDLFSGIGGFSLGLERAGFETIAFCEIDSNRRKRLNQLWPNIPIYEDIRYINGARWKGTIDVVCGGFPCQPFSLAGKQRGENDDRYLWPEMLRVIKEVRPTWVICENVAGIIGVELNRVLSDLEDATYDVQPFVIPACAVDAKHRRDRVWIIANANANANAKDTRTNEKCQIFNVADAKGSSNGLCDRKQIERQEQELRNRFSESGRTWAIEPRVDRTFDGLPTWLDRNKGLILHSHKLVLAYVKLNYGNIDNAEAQSKRAREILRTLRDEIGATGSELQAGRFRSFQEKEVLFAYLRELEEKWTHETWVQLESTKTSEEGLRGVRPPKESSGAPYRPELSTQRGGEHPDSLQALSRLLAHDAKEAFEKYSGKDAISYVNPWRGNWEKGIPRVAHGIPHRMDRIRGLGNAVVPQIPEMIGRAIMSVENEKPKEI